jgi:predicted exporter
LSGSASRIALAAWLLFVGACVWIVAQGRFTADMSAFLPSLATPLQRLLAEQLRDGVASRLMLGGIEGVAPEQLAQISRGIGRRLEGRPEFAYIANGEERLAQADREFLLAHRYVLSPAVMRERFERPALAAALERAYEALASPAGVIVRRYLPADPTGEFLRVLGVLEGQARPTSHLGVWFAPDRQTALFLAQTAAAGFDIDAQQRNIALIEQAFAEARQETGAEAAALRLTGPPVFGVRSRDGIRSDVRRLSAVAAGLIALLLLTAFRTPRLLVLAFVPVATGALGGIAAVSAWFGTVHAITLGFGITLIGEAVDYAIYLFSQRHEDEAPAQSLRRIWPTLRLGTLVSVASFCAMLFSGFPGLAQLGLFSAVGLVIALLTTRGVLPQLVGARAQPRGVDAVTSVLPRWRAPLRMRLLAIALIFIGGVAVTAWHRPIWDDDLARLNPVSTTEQALDQRLRTALGAPDVRVLLVVAGTTQEDVLERCEAIAAPLGDLVREGAIAGFDSPAFYLPARRTQAARQQALPDSETLRENLRAVVAASPFQADLFAPFVRDVAAARSAAPLERSSFRGTALSLKVDSLLLERDGMWYALLPVRGVTDPRALAQRATSLLQAGVEVLDIKNESAVLLGTYREHALKLWVVGLALIVALLWLEVRSAVRVLAVIAPLAAAVATTCAILLAAGAKLTLFHLVALLLVVGVGSNYALFFDRMSPVEAERRRTAFAIVFCAATTVLAFGLLAWSHAPVLQMIGTTVALGAVASLLFGALIARWQST